MPSFTARMESNGRQRNDRIISRAAFIVLILWAAGPLWGQGEPGRVGDGKEEPAGAPPAASGRAAPGAGQEAGRASSVAAAQTISESQLVGLPLNGRSYSQLATLQAGVTDPSAGSSSRGGGSGSLNVVGGRSTSNTFLLDGTNIMDTENQVPRSAAGVQLGSDAVLRVQVLSSFYGAEYGRGSGGVLNSITRSGTPQFHGTFFEYFRNSNLDARNFFDPGSEPAPFKRNQFGFTLTGPVWKDRTFLMGSFEALRDRLTETNIDFFPDALARQGILTDPAGRVLQTVEVHPSVKPYLALFPFPNAGTLGGGIGQNAAPQFLPTTENFLTVRLDHKVSGRDSFFVRYTFDDATSQNGETTYLWNDLVQSRQQYATLVASHIFNPRVLSSFRFGYTRPVANTRGLGLIDIPRSLFFVPEAPQFGQILIPSLSTLGPSPSLPNVNFMNSFQLGSDLLAQRGSHGLRLGFELHRYRLDGHSNFYKSAAWTFNSLESFLQGGTAGTNLTVGLPGSDNRREFRQTFAGLYLQDEQRISAQFRLSWGLRYELVSAIRDQMNRNVFISDTLRDQTLQVGPLFKGNPSLRSLAPRISLSWTPWQSRETVLQAGFGIYYDQIIGYAVSQRKATAPSYKYVVNPNFDSSATFPDALAAAALPGTFPPRVVFMDYRNTKTPTIYRYQFSLQQPLPGGWDLQASYVGARGNHLLRRYETNLFPTPIVRPDGSLFFPDDCLERQRQNLVPSPLCRPGAGPVNPAFGSFDLLNTDAQSFYNSFQFTASRRLSRGVALQASYSFSKSVDDESSSSGNTSQYGLMRTLERGLSDFNIRHRLTMNYFWTLPSSRGQRGWSANLLSGILGGWRLGGIVSFRTGSPSTLAVNTRTPGYLFSPNRPNLLPGRSNNPTEGVTAGCSGVEAGKQLSTPDLHYDPCAFDLPPPGTLGNLGRNTVIGPSIFNADVSLQKEFSFDARRRLQFRAEFFNLLNHPNFGKNINNTTIVFAGNSGRRSSSAGRRAQSATTARQLQFALRFSF